jgi:hypothetical protein
MNFSLGIEKQTQTNQNPNNKMSTTQKQLVIKPENLDLNKVSFSDVKVDSHGRKMVYVNCDETSDKRIRIQTPRMFAWNGIKRWRKDDAVDNKGDSFEMELSLGVGENQDKNALRIQSCHSKLDGFDDLVKANIISRSKEWLGKQKVSMASIEETDLYSHSVRVAKDKEGNLLPYPSKVRSKIDRERHHDDNDEFTGRLVSSKKRDARTKECPSVLIYDAAGQLLEINESNYSSVVPPGTEVIAVLELVYLTISTKVSPKWKLVQAQVFPKAQAITGNIMLDEEEEDEVLEDLDSDTPEPKVENVEFEESDVVEENEDELEVVEEPLTPVKKTKAKRGVVA